MTCPDGLSLGFGIPAPASSAICFIKSYFGRDTGGHGVYRTGSGVLIDSGAIRQHVVTAAHNLYHHGVRRNAKWVSLWFRRDAEASLATRDAQVWNIPNAFRAAPMPTADHDYGVISLNPLGSDRFTGVSLSLSTAAGVTRKLLSAYPDEGRCRGSARPHHAIFDVEPSGASTYGYKGQQTYIGMSGGALLTREPESGNWRTWGIHIRGGNDEQARAVRFSTPVHEQILGWL